MSEKTIQTAPIPQLSENKKASRLMPLAVAGVVCFIISVILGYGAWYFFGSHNLVKVEQTVDVEMRKAEIPNSSETSLSPADIAPTPAVAASPETVGEPEIEGTVKVEGGEFVLGGGETKLPLKRVIVGDFAIAETEVTNAQYAEFIKETDHAAPADWKDNEFSEGGGNLPVTQISWRDAEDFCKWMGGKLDAEVRLPSEAEWELAARGRDGRKYPWGEKWNKEAANSLENGAKISAVKRFPQNRSPFGAFDMAGNVWEWTRDKAVEANAADKDVKEALKSGEVLRVIKGGSAKEPASQISALARYSIPETTKSPNVGFRYVVVRRKQK